MSNYTENLEAQKIFKSCKICDGKGFILDRIIREKNEYIYTLHCTCQLGNEHKEYMYSVDSQYNTNDIISRRQKQIKIPVKEETIQKVKDMLERVANI